MVEKTVKICDECNKTIAMQKCDFCGKDLCLACVSRVDLLTSHILGQKEKFLELRICNKCYKVFKSINEKADKEFLDDIKEQIKSYVIKKSLVKGLKD